MSAAVDLHIRNAARLRTDFLLFIVYFYPLLTGRDFKISAPKGRESHFRVIARELENCFYLRSNRLIINVPPGHGKTTLLTFYMAWCLANYPDCNFIYVSYSMPRAYGATEMCRNIVMLKEFGQLFGVYVKSDSRGKKEWSTTAGGKIVAFGSEGPVTGADAGLPYPLNRCTGAIILDDLHNLATIHSDPIREGVWGNYLRTMKQRPRSHVVPIIAIGQRGHEADYIGYLLKKVDGVGDGYEWRNVILKAIDECGNALYPEVFPLEDLLKWQEVDEYNFSAQGQQEPIPAGGALYKPEYFPLLPEDPNMVCTFITADTAATEDTQNSATAFTFFGLYKIPESDVWAIHVIDSYEEWIAPERLESEFLSFWSSCKLYKTPPSIIAIENKSTGVTLLPIIRAKLRGVDVRDIERTGKDGSKGDRYLQMKPDIYNGRISLTYGKPHVDNFIRHMAKITPNCTHRHGDICDTVYDGWVIGILNTTLQSHYSNKHSAVQQNLALHLRQQITARNKSYFGADRRI